MAVPARGPDVRDAARAPTTNGASGVPVRQPPLRPIPANGREWPF